MIALGQASRPARLAGGALILASVLVPQAGPTSQPMVRSDSSPSRLVAARKVSATRSFGTRSLGQSIKGCFIGLKSPIHVVVVDKAAQKLHLFRHYKKTTLVRTYPCATGENSGHKVVEGDHRTPEGVYFIIRVYRDKRMTIFGKQAWHLNYPNPVDRLRGRRGNGIYIHGLNKKLTPRSTKGCIALRQKDLDHLSRHLELYRTAVVVTSRLRGSPRFDDPKLCARLRAIAARHGRSLIGQPPAAAAAIHLPRHLRRDLHPLDAAQAENVAPSQVASRQFGLIRFMNQTHVWFRQDLTLAGGRKAPVWRRLTFLDRAGRPGLLASEWRPKDRRLLALARRPSVRVAARPLPPAGVSPVLDARRKPIADLVQNWVQAWQKKNIKAYIAFYDESFRSQGMNRAQWRRYKDGLNRRYRFIRVQVSRLRVNLVGPDLALATFHQNYRSNYFNSRSIKALELVKRDGRWLIRREESGRQARLLRLAVLRRMVAARPKPVKVAARTPLPKPAPKPKPVKTPKPALKPVQVPKPVKTPKPAQAPKAVQAPKAAQAAPAQQRPDQRVADLIRQWSRAWQHKDLKTYIAFYDKSFRAQGMNRAQWKRYKDRLNRRYRFIRIKVSRVRVRRQGADRAVATFHLSYRSNYFHSRGVKTLVLVKRGGWWRIKRETFRRLGG
jgi:murein L,D-transpeptidase YafK